MTDCKHETIIETLRPSGPHYSDLRCSICNKHMGFGMSPAAKAKRQKQQAAIVLLRNEPRLQAKDKAFINSLDTQGPKVSPNQELWLNDLIQRFLT